MLFLISISKLPRSPHRLIRKKFALVVVVQRLANRVVSNKKRDGYKKVAI